MARPPPRSIPGGTPVGGGTPIRRPPPGTLLPNWWAVLGNAAQSAGVAGVVSFADLIGPVGQVIPQGSVLPICYGRVIVQGEIVWSGSPLYSNSIIDQAFLAVFCEGEIDSIQNLYFGGWVVDPAGVSDDSGTIISSIRWTGAAAGIADGHTWRGSGWVPTSTYSYDRFKNVAAASVECFGWASGGVMPWWQRLHWDPSWTVVLSADVKGRKIYDPRGGGSTAWSANPALIVRDLLVTYGKVPAGSIDDVSFGAAATACESLGFICNIAFAQKETLDAAINEVLLTCCGALTPSNGKLGIFIDQANAGAAALTLLESDGGISNVSFEYLSAQARPTRVIVQFLNASANYKTDSVTVEDTGIAGGTVPLRETTYQIRGCTATDKAKVLADYLYNSAVVTGRLKGTVGFQGVLLSRGTKVHIKTLSGIDADFLVEQPDENAVGLFPSVFKPYDAAVYVTTPLTQGPPVVVDQPSGLFTPPAPAPPIAAPFGLTCHFRRDGSSNIYLPPIANLIFQPSRLYVYPVAAFVSSFWSQSGFATFDGTKINDGDMTTTAATVDVGGTGYLKFDAGAGNVRAFGRCAAWGGGTKVSHSDNGSTWTDVTAVNGQSSYQMRTSGLVVVGTMFEWDSPTEGAHRYWRVEIDGGFIGATIQEVQFYEIAAAQDTRSILYDVYAVNPNNGSPLALLATLTAAPTSSVPFPVNYVNTYPGSSGAVAIVAVSVQARDGFFLADWQNGGGEATTVPATVPLGASASASVLAQDPASTVVRQPIGANLNVVRTALSVLEETTLPSVSAAGEAKIAMDSSDHALKQSINGAAWAGFGGGSYVNLQASTPGTQQTGHLNISGTAVVGNLSATTGSLAYTLGATGSPAYALTVTINRNAVEASANTGGLSVTAVCSPATGTVGNVIGALIDVENQSGTSATLTNATGVYSSAAAQAGTTITNRFGFYVSDATGSGSVTNQYGIYIPSLTKGGTLNYAVYTAASTPSYFGGTVTAGAFSGPLTGNVTGNCSGSSGSCTGNAATSSDGLTSATGTAPLTLTLSAKALTGSVAITTTNDGGAVVKQATTPGTQQTGNINISGKIIVSSVIFGDATEQTTAATGTGGTGVGPDSIFGWAGQTFPYNNGSVTDITISGATTWDASGYPDGVVRCRKLTINASVTLTIRRSPFFIFADEVYGAGASAVIDASGESSIGVPPTTQARGGRAATAGAGFSRGGCGGGILIIVCNKTTGTAITIKANGGAGTHSGTTQNSTQQAGEGAFSRSGPSTAGTNAEQWQGSNAAVPGTAPYEVTNVLGDGAADTALGGYAGGSGAAATFTAGGGSGIGGGGSTGAAGVLPRLSPPAPTIVLLALNGCLGGGGGAATSSGPKAAGGGGGAVCVWRKSSVSTVTHTLTANGGAADGAAGAGAAGVTYDNVMA